LSALVRGQLNINALMSVAVAGAFLIGQWPEAAMVMALYSLAEADRGTLVERARHAITGLLALSPPQAEVRQPDGTWSRPRPGPWRSGPSSGSSRASASRWTAGSSPGEGRSTSRR
jgi:hypothetical protein